MRYLFNYRLYGTGIVPKWSSIPLTTGGCVHKGVEAIVVGHLDPKSNPIVEDKYLCDSGTRVALEEYEKIVLTHPLASNGLPEQQQAIYQEQLALTEALVRLWYMYEWPKIVQYYDILAVEQEIVFPLSEGILYQSKPDLILLHKQNGDVVNYSLKTAKSFSDRLEKSYKVQMQAATEPYATAHWLRSLKEQLIAVNSNIIGMDIGTSIVSAKVKAIEKYFEGLLNKLPDQSSATRFCYLIKGDFKEDKRGSGIYRTDSSLIYGWRKLTPSGFEYAAINKVPKPENQSGYGLLGKGWERFKVWEDEEVGGVKGWLEMIQKGERVCNDIGEGPILEKYIVSQPDIYTNPSLIDSKISQITRIEADIWHRLQSLSNFPESVDHAFPMNTNSCFWPTNCAYLAICPTGSDYYKDHIASDPLNDEWGMFERRISHHLPEKEFMDSLVQIEGVSTDAQSS